MSRCVGVAPHGREREQEQCDECHRSVRNGVGNLLAKGRYVSFAFCLFCSCCHKFCVVPFRLFVVSEISTAKVVKNFFCCLLKLVDSSAKKGASCFEICAEIVRLRRGLVLGDFSEAEKYLTFL